MNPKRFDVARYASSLIHCENVGYVRIGLRLAAIHVGERLTVSVFHFVAAGDLLDSPWRGKATRHRRRLSKRNPCAHNARMAVVVSVSRHERGRFSASHYPAKLVSFVVSCGQGSRSECEPVGWIVRVVANVGSHERRIVTIAVSDGIICARHGDGDRAVLDGDPQLANEVFLGHADVRS